MNFKSTTIVFIITTCVLGFLIQFSGTSFAWLILPAFVYSVFIVYGSAKIQSSFYIKALCNSTTSKKEIAITFDDGPNPEFTPKVLSLLAEYNVPATFFVIGKKIKDNEKLLQQINSEGHTLGNHTYSHSFFIDFKNTIGFLFELNLTSDAVYNAIGKRMKLFRPPYGVTTPQLAKASKALNYHVIGWSIRSMDTTNDSEEVIIKRVLEQIKPGAVILFHDTSEKTIQVLKQTINFAHQNGFKFVSLESLLNIKAYE